MTAADYLVEVAWNGIDFEAIPDERVLDRGTPVSVSYGRDQARALATTAPGRASFELDDTDGDYNPENTSSPLAGMVRPARPVRIQATLDGTSYGVFRGATDDYNLLPDPDERLVQISCVDALARLQGVRVSTELHEGVHTGEAIGLLLDAVGWDANLRDLDQGATMIPWWWVDNTDAWAALTQLLDAEGPGSMVTVDIDGQFVFRDRHHKLTRAAAITAQATFRSGGTLEPCFSEMAYDAGWKEIVNSITFDVPVRQPGELAAVWSTQGQTTIPDGQTVAVAATATNPFRDAQVPEEGVDYELISGTVSMTLSRTSGASATVYVTASGGAAVVSDLQLRAQPLDTVTTVQVTVEDPTSIALYGPRSWPSGRDPELASVPDALGIASLIVGQRAQRLPTVSITFKGGADERVTQQLARDLSDRVRIVDELTGLDADFWVEQIQHTISEDHRTVFGCEKVPAQELGVLILNDATYGLLNTGTLGGAGLAAPATVFLLDSATQGKLNHVGSLLGY